MAEAILRAGLSSGVLSTSQVIVADPSDERRALFAALGVETAHAAADVIARAEQVLFAVKPQVFGQVAQAIHKQLQPSQVVVSIMAGVTTQRLAEAMQHPRGARDAQYTHVGRARHGRGNDRGSRHAWR